MADICEDGNEPLGSLKTNISKFKLRSSSTTGIGAYNSDTTGLDVKLVYNLCKRWKEILGKSFQTFCKRKLVEYFGTFFGDVKNVLKRKTTLNISCDTVTTVETTVDFAITVTRLSENSSELAGVAQTTTCIADMIAIEPSSSFVPISLQRDVIVVHRSGEIRNTLYITYRLLPGLIPRHRIDRYKPVDKLYLTVKKDTSQNVHRVRVYVIVKS
ncbi:hypothetical protein ANN_19710 [Periplaneta americana]|uniref:Uncharacterized protein n=1 Tax=Periplaneta americana TaxID=6978 RepID=A0ABQ8SBJ3_PERAM|nr:hypothetical protein ANN_19710 [Periplaneta americana]